MTDNKVNSKSKKSFNLPAYINTPYFVYIDDSLSEKEKRLFSHLYSYYTAGKTIKASNAYYAALLGVEPRSVRRILDGLETKGWIYRDIFPVAPNNSKRIIKIIRKGEGKITYEDDSDSMQNEEGWGHDCPPGGDTNVPPVGTRLSPYIKVDNKINNNTYVASSENFTEEVKEIQKLVIEKLKDETFTLLQASNLLSIHKKEKGKTNIEMITWSLDNYLVHLQTEAGKDVGSKIGCFLFHIKKSGFFEQKHANYTQDKKPEDVLRERTTQAPLNDFSNPNDIETKKRKCHDENFNIELGKWWANLYLDKQLKTSLGFANMPMANQEAVSYFAKNIWPDIFKQLLEKAGLT